jgi:hypothetical protein
MESESDNLPHSLCISLDSSELINLLHFVMSTNTLIYFKQSFLELFKSPFEIFGYKCTLWFKRQEMQAYCVIVRVHRLRYEVH